MGSPPSSPPALAAEPPRVLDAAELTPARWYCQHRATRSRAAAEVDEAPSAPTPKAPARTSSRTNNRAAAADKRAAAAAAASEAFSDSSVDSRDDEGDSNAEETPVRGKRTPQAAPKTSVAAVAATRGVKRTAAAPDSGSDAGEQLDDDDDDDDELASPTSSGRRSSVRRAGSAPQTPMAVRKQAPAAQRAKQAKPKAPAKNKPKKAAAASNNGGNDDGDNNENDENNSEINDAPLYETVIEHGAAIETVMSDWLRAFKSDKMGSMHQVVNFLIRASGCDAQVDREAVEDSDEIAAALEAIQEQCNTDAQQDYPLAPKGKGRSAAKFRCAFVAFWTRWTNTVSSQLLSIGDSSPIELLARWLATMSSASFRPFRHTATIAALATMTGLCTAAQFVLTALVTAQRQVAAEEGKGASRRLEQMRSRVSDLQARKDRLEQHMLDIYDGIFVHRYRDTDPVIRAECIRELGVWIATYPEFYLETAHLRYLGWMLSDKAAHVRMEALKSLCRLYKTDALVSGLREFTNRFMARMMEMGASEKDSAVRHEAAQAICLLANAGMLEDTDYEAVVPLIFDADPKIRTIVAPLVAGWYKDTFQQPVLDEYLAVGTLRDSQRSLIELKTLAQALCRISELVAERLRPAAPKQPSAGQASSQMQSQLAASQSQSQLAGEDMDMDDAQEFANATDDFRFDTHGMSAHHEDDVAQLKKDLEHVVDYAKAQAGSGSSADAADSQLGFNSVCAAVSALWKHIGCLSDYKRMGEYLLLDDADAEAGKPRAQRGAARGRASSAADVDDEGTPSLQLSEIEETCLVFMMAASVACVLADADQDASAPAKPAKTAAGDTAETAEAARQGVSEALIRFVPLLLQKYGTEVSGTVHERLVEVVALVRSIQLGMYLHTRQSKQFEALFDDLAKLFLAQYEPAFLREACETFKFLLGRDAVDASSAALLAKPKSRVDAMQPSGASASASVLHSIADAKLHDLVDALFARQLANATSQLALDATPESLTALTRSVVRARELMFHIDLSGTDVFVASRTQVDASQGENLGVVDATLNAVLESLKHLSDGVSPDQERELLALASVAMQGAIEIATFDLAFQVKQAYEAHQRSNRSAESNGGARADADGDADMDQDGQASPVDPAVQRRLRGRCDSIVTLCEAIATNTSHIADITFTLPMRWACVRTLMSIYPLINGEAGEAFPDLVHRPSPDVMAESAFLVDRLVHLSTFIETPVPEGVIAAGLTGAAAREAARRALLGVGGAAYLRHAIFKTADGLRRMASFGMFARRHGNVLLKYYGIDAPQLETWLRKLSFLDAQRDGHEVSGVRPIAGVLGAVWGGLSSALIEDVVGAGIKRAVSDYTSRLAQGVSERHALSLAKDAIQDLCDLILDSIAASIDLHLTTRSPSLDHTHALAKALVAQLKTWPSVLTPGGIEAVTPALKQLHSVTVRALLVMLCDAGTWMARRTSAWRSLSQSMTKRRQSGFTEMTSFLSDTTRMGANVSLDEDASAWTCASFGIVADAARVNSAWQVWGVIGGVVAHVVQGLFVLVPRGAETDAPQRDTVTSTEGV
nr:hypothetical protein HK105_006844 [Polyrhizophydium stewartii]